MQDAFGDIYGIHARGAVLQQAISEPARRSAQIRADQSFYVKLKRIQRRSQLISAARDVAWSLVDSQRRIWDDFC